MPENVPSTRDRVLARLAREFDSSAETIAAFLDRLSAGAKIPYLATFERLRSEGDSKRSLDAKRMFEIRDRVQELEMLEEHKTVVLDAAEREGWRDEAITARVLEMTDLDDLEDEWQAIRRRHTGVAKEARDRGLEPLARISGYAGHAQAPEWFTTAPAGSIEGLLKKTGHKVDDVDLWEINEAFAVVSLVNQDRLGIASDRLNVRGGAVALGHPIGASGCRLLVTLLHAMKQDDKKRGVVSLCIGGGEAVAVMVERDGDASAS